MELPESARWPTQNHPDWQGIADGGARRPPLPILRTRQLVSGYPRKKGRATKVDAATRVNSNEAEVIYTRRLLDTICSYCMLRTELF